MRSKSTWWAFAIIGGVDPHRLQPGARPEAGGGQDLERSARSRCAAFLLRHVEFDGGVRRPGRRLGRHSLRPTPSPPWRCRSSSHWPAGGWARRTLNTLLDTAPAGATEIVRDIVSDVHGVLAIKSLRLRPAGPTMFTSIVVEVARTMPIDDIVRTKDAIHDQVQERFPNADITVTANPVPLDSERCSRR